jgi:hypothetical protein
MPGPALNSIQDGFDQLLGGAAAYYARVEERLASEEPDTAQRAQLEDALMRATQLIEVLESVTYDRIRWLARADVTA